MEEANPRETKIPSVMRFLPAVFAVGNEYQIMIPVKEPTIMWIQVGTDTYYDESNGILRSDTDLHKITVPMSALDTAGEYTVCWKKMIERKPYFPLSETEERATFAFTPLRGELVRAYMIADAHGHFEKALGAAKLFIEQQGGIDLLILNGDVVNHSGKLEYFDIYYQLSQEITGGSVPVIVSRGNHDLRGVYAEKLALYTPGENGNSYFSFRLGDLWGLVLDCGEDKNDDHPEYGGTICCHAFRERETAYLDAIIENAKHEYNAPGVEHKIIVSHVPFTEIPESPFDIEQDIYKEWVERLNDDIQPDVMLCGHVHEMYVTNKGEEKDAYGAEFPVVVGSKLHEDNENEANTYFAGCGIVIENEEIRIFFNDSEKVLQEIKLS
ncbi:MAG: hypothetical protein E7680_02350 [Ruminococcaceae bacterium]|nr:hypothetical protein [Oscillospiraceae bacterium]